MGLCPHCNQKRPWEHKPNCILRAVDKYQEPIRIREMVEYATRYCGGPYISIGIGRNRTYAIYLIGRCKGMKKVKAEWIQMMKEHNAKSN